MFLVIEDFTYIAVRKGKVSDKVVLEKEEGGLFQGSLSSMDLEKSSLWKLSKVLSLEIQTRKKDKKNAYILRHKHTICKFMG